MHRFLEYRIGDTRMVRLLMKWMRAGVIEDGKLHKHARGEMFIVRYADDVVMGFQYEQDARAMRGALAARIAKFGLELHPDKTRVIRFGRFAGVNHRERGLGKPETFDFLGFTHIAAVSRDGKFLLKRRTSRKKRRAKLGRVDQWERRPATAVDPQSAVHCSPANAFQARG